MDLLLLAHLVADGNQDAKASSAPLWAAWVPAVIALLGTLLVAWRSGRKTDKQMELSKEATPPELTRYKEWLEISEKYKELVNFENVDALSKASGEYKEIEASRRAAFERAVWERKVLATCPSILLQKRLLGISPRVMDAENFDIYNFAYSRMHLTPKIVDGICVFVAVCYIISVLCSIKNFFGINMGFAADPVAQNDGQLLFNRIFGPLIILFLLLFLGLVLKAHFNTAKEEYYIRTLVVEKRGSIEISLEKERNAAKNRLRLVSMSGAAEFIYIPWGEGVRWSWVKRTLSVIHPMHYVKKGFNGRSDVIWGSYKEENLNGDLENRIKGFESWGQKLKKQITGVFKKSEIEDGGRWNLN